MAVICPDCSASLKKLDYYLNHARDKRHGIYKPQSESVSMSDCTSFKFSDGLSSSEVQMESVAASVTDAPEPEEYGRIERPERALTDMDGLPVSARAVSEADAQSVSVNTGSDSYITASTVGDTSVMPTTRSVRDIRRPHISPASTVVSFPTTPVPFRKIHGASPAERHWETRDFKVQGAPQHDTSTTSTEVSTESSVTATVQTPSASQSQLTIPSPPAPTALSWRCRSCGSDPCEEPTATQCGHIFCYGCIVREITENMQCPVCRTLFLLRLNVN